MTMGIDWDTPVSELRHSGIDGLNEIGDDELMHWKYVKREKVNGKWRYYYDVDQLKDDLGVDEYQAYKKAETEKQTADSEERSAIDDYDKKRNFANKLRRGSDVVEKRIANMKSGEAEVAARKATAKAKAAGKKYVESKQKLFNTPIGKVVKFNLSVKSTYNKVTKWIRKLGKKKK